MILEPNQEILNDLSNTLDIGLPLYMNYAGEFGDCADTLAELLTNEGKINWEVCPWVTTKAVLPYIHSASVMKTGQVNIILDPETVEADILDIDEFKKYVIHAIEHEAVHVSQRDRMGGEFYESSARTSGFQKMQLYYLSRTTSSHTNQLFNLTHEEEKTGMRMYLSDYLELMAHAKDLSSEIMYADEPLVALRDPEGFIDFLPTWFKYRQAGFLRSDQVIKDLLKYTYNYVILSLEQDK